MKLIFAGTSEHAAQVLAHLLDSSMHEVVCVLTREDAPVGRKAVVTPSPVASLANSRDVPVVKANRLNESANSQIDSFGAELGVVVAYGTLLPVATLGLLKHGWLNIHYSALPSYRGAAPVQRALMAGENETAVTIFRLDEGMDTGPVISQAPVSIQPLENSGELLSRMTNIGISVLDETLATIAAGVAVFRDQPIVGTFAPKLVRQDCRIDWNKNAQYAENLIRGANPEPMAWTMLAGQNFRILEACVNPISIQDLAPGTVLEKKGRVLVSCGDNTCLQLLVVQPSGKPVMKANDWLRGQNKAAIFDE